MSSEEYVKIHKEAFVRMISSMTENYSQMFERVKKMEVRHKNLKERVEALEK